MMMGPFDASAWVAKSARRATRRVARTGRSLLNMADDETGEEGEWSEVEVGRNVEGVTDPVPPASCPMWQFCLSQVHLHLDASRGVIDFDTRLWVQSSLSSLSSSTDQLVERTRH